MNTFVGAVCTVGLGAVVVGAAALVLHSAPTEPPLLAATVTAHASSTPGVTSEASLELATYGDSSQITWRRTNDGQGPHDWVSYGPTTDLQVPAHALVTVTIQQYDSGEPIPNTFLATVQGTVGGAMTVDGEKVSQIDSESVGHTFTVHNYPSTTQDPLYINVPLPAVSDEEAEAADAEGRLSKPHVVVFQFITGSAGTYAWNCEFPCGDGTYAKFGDGMSSYGYMSGTLHVV
jgi:hypothetical protein